MEANVGKFRVAVANRGEFLLGRAGLEPIPSGVLGTSGCHPGSHVGSSLTHIEA